MAKRIKIKGKAPRGLSKRERQDIHHFTNRGSLGGRYGAGRNRDLMYTVKRVNRDGTVEPHVSPFADENPMSRPSSTRKKRVKEGNRKFIGPRQFSGELKEDRGRRSPREDRRFNRMMSREYLEQDDPTVDVGPTGPALTGKLRGGLSPAVVAKLKEAVRKLAAKPQKSLTAKELKFLSTVDATGRFLGNYPGISRA